MYNGFMAEKSTTKLGRPTKYREEMLPIIIELMSVGASLLEVAGALDIDDETIQDWKDPNSPRYNEAFSVTIKKGINLSEIWWQRKGRTSLENKDFSYVGWYMNMKNRFGWKDKQEVEQTITADVTSNGETIGSPELAAGYAEYLKSQTQH